MRQVEATVNNIMDEIRRERERQIAEEGWTPEHDDQHTAGELALAGSAYAHGAAFSDQLRSAGGIPSQWPFESSWWKPKTRRRDLIRAAALIWAEIDRLDRKQGRIVSATLLEDLENLVAKRITRYTRPLGTWPSEDYASGFVAGYSMATANFAEDIHNMIKLRELKEEGLHQ